MIKIKKKAIPKEELYEAFMEKTVLNSGNKPRTDKELENIIRLALDFGFDCGKDNVAQKHRDYSSNYYKTHRDAVLKRENLRYRHKVLGY